MTTNAPAHFLTLPTEIRLQIYNDYFEESSPPPASFIHEERTLHGWSEAVPILTVNKEIFSEVWGEMRRRQSFTYRISWQDCTFDGLARSCFAARQRKPDYDDMCHLRIEIYPPRRDRPTDMVHIWRHTLGLFTELQRVSRLQQLTIVFLENDIANWSIKGEPREYLGLGREESDVEHLMDIFMLLVNVAKVQIQLPPSLREDINLNELREFYQHGMMKQVYDQFDTWKAGMDSQAWYIKKYEPCLRWAEERISEAKKKKMDFQPDKLWISAAEHAYLHKIWPRCARKDILPDQKHYPDRSFPRDAEGGEDELDDGPNIIAAPDNNSTMRKSCLTWLEDGQDDSDNAHLSRVFTPFLYQCS